MPTAGHRTTDGRWNRHQYGFLWGRRQQHRPFGRPSPAPHPGGLDPLCGYGGGASPHLRLPGHHGPLAEGPRDAAHHQSLQDHTGRKAADFGAGVLAERHPALDGLRLQAVFPETQDRAAGQVLQPLPALPQGMGGGKTGGEVHRLRRRRELPQRQSAAGRPGRPKVQQVVSPDGMGMGPGGLPASHRRCGPAPAGQILLLLLPQHEGGGDHPPAGPPPGPVPKGHRLGRQRPPQFENGPGPGP